MSADQGRRRSALLQVLDAAADLVLPVGCGGCDAPGERWCRRCAARLADAPLLLRPRVTVGVPAWALGRYRGPHRRALLVMKEHGRRDLAVPLGLALAEGLGTLARWGELPDAPRLRLVPAPTRRSSARRRGGDPVSAMAEVAATASGPSVERVDLLATSSFARDSAGLDAAGRARNLAGSVRIRRPPTPTRGPITTVLVDDVLTTGATAAESVRVLAEHGVQVDAVLVVAAA